MKNKEIHSEILKELKSVRDLFDTAPQNSTKMKFF